MIRQLFFYKILSFHNSQILQGIRAKHFNLTFFFGGIKIDSYLLQSLKQIR
jgi:hypothetical protein